MQASKLQHPVLNVTIGGTATKKRPSYFSLLTDQDFHSVVASLRFPADMEVGKTGDPVTVNLSLADEKHILFTGEIYSEETYRGNHVFGLTDGYKKLTDTQIIAAYRKETASVILQDTLDKAGISKTAIACPTVEIARFSTENIPADRCIEQLIKALEEHGFKGLRFFFDADNTFRFGTADDIGKNEGKVYEFETGKNIFRKAEGHIHVLPLPIRHSQEIRIDGVNLVTYRTDLTVSGSCSRLRLWPRGKE